MEIYGEIKSIEYKTFLSPDKLEEIDILEINQKFQAKTFYKLKIGEDNEFAISWWVSAKRTRSYPYERVYNTLAYSGKKVTVIPIFKDEGADGDRDYLQWDTISLMSLLDIYVIIAYYNKAIKSPRSKNINTHKITKQLFDSAYIKEQLDKLMSYRSSALHWNMDQVNIADRLMETALQNYSVISKATGVKMTSEKSAYKRIAILKSQCDAFRDMSRGLSQKAQAREVVTLQPKENIIEGRKASITIKNFLGGYYFFTADEAYIEGNYLFLIEAKDSRSSAMPALSDIKDGLIKMVLFCNLKRVTVNEKEFNVIPVLKITGNKTAKLTKKQEVILSFLRQEAVHNNFIVDFNYGGSQ